MALILFAVSCNSKTNNDETEIAVTPALVAVKNFYLKANDSVMKNLDSVYFSIDLKTGVIFNADSLPKGSDISKLVASITFANTMTKAEISFTNSEDELTSVDYLKNPNDSIDFSKPVTLDVTAADGLNTFTYTIKVNVHQQDPDTLIWDKLASSELPSRLPAPLAQKTVYRDGITYCLIEENDGSYTLATSKDIYEGDWTKEIFKPEFVPELKSLTVSPDGFYLLDKVGTLYLSDNLSSWIEVETDWVTILGTYGSGILGIKKEGDTLWHAAYPMPEGFIETELEAGFPVYNSSSLGLIESKWADMPMAILAGGVISSGLPTSDVWAYDGRVWTVINEGSLPELESPALVRYVVYRDLSKGMKKREFDVWMILGGFTKTGLMNRDVYISYDNGVNWSLAPDSMQLPEKFPELGGADVIVADYEFSADLSDSWTLLQPNTKANYEIDGTDIYWECPFLYLFGGYEGYPDKNLNTTIYRGVLNRLTFTPVI